MENKRVATLVTVMIVMAMGNLLVQTEAQASPLPPFLTCFPSCLMGCAAGKPIQQAFMCPLTCIMKCMSPGGSPGSPPQMTLANKIDNTDYFCKIGCATHQCLRLTSLQNPNVEKVADCVDSCSNKCSNKN